jgi:hypothetical protein
MMRRQRWIRYETTCFYTYDCPDGHKVHLREHIIPGHWERYDDGKETTTDG